MLPTLFDSEHLLQRYLDGDCEAVWVDLLSLGDDVNFEPYLTSALQVCREMTRRSRENLLTIVERLAEMNFEFWVGPPYNNGIGEHALLISRDVADPWSIMWSRGTMEVGLRVLGCEPDSPRILPLALRVWLNELGGCIHIRGRHPVICPFVRTLGSPDVYTDPFSICPTFHPGASWVPGFQPDEFDEVTDYLFFSDSDIVKSMYWSDEYWKKVARSEDEPDAYFIRCPNGAIDAKIEGIWYETTFVGYLRKNFEWGGFPGWERYPNRPEKELQFLREGLLPI